MRFFMPKPGEPMAVQIRPPADKSQTYVKFNQEHRVDRPCCECPSCEARAARGERPREVSFVNVLDENNKLKVLSVPAVAMKEVKRIYEQMAREQADRTRLLRSYQKAARRFKTSKLLYRKK